MLKFNFKNFFNNKKKIKQEEVKKEKVKCFIKRGIFSVEGKLIAGVYYSDKNLKAIATDLGCIKLFNEPKLIEKMDIKTTKIESLLLKLKYKKVENFINIKELC